MNGCAGSGKTTILLQRIAYLMYQAKDKRMSDMLLLSRNQLFAKYVSHVIPSLTGSELYQQTLAQHTIELYRKCICIKQRAKPSANAQSVLNRQRVDCACTPQYRRLIGERFAISCHRELKDKPYLR